MKHLFLINNNFFEKFKKVNAHPLHLKKKMRNDFFSVTFGVIGIFFSKMLNISSWHKWAVTSKKAIVKNWKGHSSNIYRRTCLLWDLRREEKKKTFGKYDNIFNMQNRNFHAISKACFLDIWKLDLEKTGIDRMPMTFNIVSLSLPPTIMNFTLRNVTNRAWNFSLCRYL